MGLLANIHLKMVRHNTTYNSLARQQPQKQRESSQTDMPASIGEHLRALNTLLQSQQKNISQPQGSFKSFPNCQNSREKYQSNSFKTNIPHHNNSPQRQQYSNKRQNIFVQTNEIDINEQSYSDYVDP